MSRTHAKHLEPKEYLRRGGFPTMDDRRVKRVVKSHKQKRVNERAKLRKDYL